MIPSELIATLLTSAFLLFTLEAGALPIAEVLTPAREQISCEHLKARVQIENQLFQMLKLVPQTEEGSDLRDREDLVTYLVERSGIPMSLLLYRDIFRIDLSVPVNGLPIEPAKVEALVVERTAVLDRPTPKGEFKRIDFKISQAEDAWQFIFAVSAADICLKESIDVTLFSNCPLDDFQFYECEANGTCLTPYVTRFWRCREQKTLKIDLTSLQDQLATRTKTIGRRGRHP